MNDVMKRWLVYALLSVIAVPLLVFIGGWLLTGPYEGEGGIFGLMATIYADALRADVNAWILLLAPLLLAAIWKCCRRLSRMAQLHLSVQTTK